MLEHPVTAAVLIIGDEILSGRTQDTNLGSIARFVGAHGIDVAEARVVGDVAEEIVAALNVLRQRYDYVFTTGGIGPTHDDITADCVAQAFGVELPEDEDILSQMRDRYGEEPNAARRRMARIPVGGVKIKNPVSGPPGFQLGNVFVMAGVPRIMQGMLEDIGWRLKGGAVVVSTTVRVEGTGEGVLAAPLEAVAKAHPGLSLGSYPFWDPANRATGFGSNLVVRGRDPDEVEAAVVELIAALEAVGVASLSRVDPAA
jgi:molybdenum cofactor synthesis domain-containing protein